MRKQRLVILSAVLVYVAALYLSSPSSINKPKAFFLNILRFPLNITTNLFSGVNSAVRANSIAKENISLRKAVDSLTSQLVQYKEGAAENTRLKRLLDFKEKTPYKLRAARVIGRDVSNISSGIIIDRGKNQGVDPDTVVITEGGLVGCVSQSSDDTSKVMVLNDPNYRVSSTVLRSRQLGMLYGAATDLCVLKYLPVGCDVKEGDEVITSGFSSIYPKGILIGYVVKVVQDNRGLSISCLVRPSVDMHRIEEVLCIE